MSEFNPVVLLAYHRARERAATARGEAALARLVGGAEARPRRLSDGEFTRKLTALWSSRGRYRSRGTSTIRLPSGRVLVYDHQAGEVVKK